MAVTVGIVGVCGDYHAHIGEWLDSVRSLNRPPDQITLLASPHESLLNLDGVQVILTGEPFHFGGWLNTAISHTRTDWIAWAGLDDRYRPTALDGIDGWTADVMAFGLQYDTGQRWQHAPPDTAGILAAESCPIPCGSPFRRWLWERRPFAEHFAPFEDWALWVGFAREGARFAATGRIDIDYQYAGHTAPPEGDIRDRLKEWGTA